jgi:hypothetical protein
MTIGLIVDIIALALMKTGTLTRTLNKKLNESAEAYRCKAAQKAESLAVRDLGKPA